MWCVSGKICPSLGFLADSEHTSLKNCVGTYFLFLKSTGRNRCKSSNVARVTPNCGDERNILAAEMRGGEE